jgi:hypothetical protein
MPKQSARKQVISGLSQHVKTQHLVRFQQELDSDDDSVEHELDVACDQPCDNQPGPSFHLP